MQSVVGLCQSSSIYVYETWSKSLVSGAIIWREQLLSTEVDCAEYTVKLDLTQIKPVKFPPTTWAHMFFVLFL